MLGHTVEELTNTYAQVDKDYTAVLSAIPLSGVLAGKPWSLPSFLVALASYNFSFSS